MSKKLVITDEMAINDLSRFLSGMGISQDRIDKFIESELISANGGPAGFMETCRLTFNEDDCTLTQKFDGGRDLVWKAKRPKLVDLNRIKPQGYDNLDDESKQLIPVSFLTGKTYRELIENYYPGELTPAIIFTGFFTSI